MTIVIDDQQKSIPFDEELVRLLERAVAVGLENTGGPRDVQVSVLLVDDEAILAMNQEYRNVDRSTDVLSFPMLEYRDDGIDDEQLVHDTDPETGEVMLGDIVISLETALRQAGEYGHGIRREVAFLAVHGLMHLRGYDHDDEDDRRLMRDKEEEIMGLLGLLRSRE